MTVDPTLLSALVSAVVALLIVVFKEFVLEPQRKRKEDETAARRAQADTRETWISDMKSNIDLLRKGKHFQVKLRYDDRPLGHIALCRPELAKAMNDVRSLIKDHNERINQYHAVMGPQIHYALMTDPRKESVSIPLIESGEIEKSLNIKTWVKDWFDLMKSRRKELLEKIETLVDMLELAS